MNNVGTLVIAPIRPQSDADVFPSAYANEIRGGHHTAADIAARDAIPTERLDVGMFCTTQDTGTVYILRQITPSLIWEEFVSGNTAETYGGTIDLNTVDYTYSVTHPEITGAPVPMITLVVPSSGDSLIVDGVTNVTQTGFDVVLASVPPTSGYQINWTNGPLIINDQAGVIGPAEDGTYEDGLFTDFVPTTPTGTAVDRFNEVLKALAPPPAPDLSSVGFSQSGVTGKLSFGSSNAIGGYTNVPSQDINSTYSNSGDRHGIFAPAVKSGTLANNIAAHPYAYPANAFGNADQGTLNLIVNGATIHTVDLAVVSGGSFTNGNGSGFTLIAPTPVEFDSGDTFDTFLYRTGTWNVAVADQVNGYNTITVTHVVGSVTNTVQTHDWVNDADVTGTVISAENLDNLAMAGSKFLSGVEYHTSGTAEYDVTIDNSYRNTYSSSAAAINFGPSNATMSDQALANMTTEADTVNVVDAGVTVSANRLLNGSISTNVTVDRTVQADVAGGADSIGGLLLDVVADNASNTNEPFNGEGYRMDAAVESNLTNTSYGSGPGASPFTWDSTASLVGGDADHNNGLLVEDGEIKYPTQGTNGGNYGAISNGPAGNVNYSGAAGNRTYYRYFYDASPRNNFTLNVTASSTNFVDVATGPSGNNVTLEILAPNTTQNGGGTIEFKDAVAPFTTINDIGMFASTFGATIPTDWGLSLGSRDTSTAGDVIVIKITASNAWTGSITNIGITWL